MKIIKDGATVLEIPGDLRGDGEVTVTLARLLTQLYPLEQARQLDIDIIKAYLNGVDTYELP